MKKQLREFLNALKNQKRRHDKVEKQIREFLQKCIDPKNWENNPILQDYMTPDVVEEIEEWLKFEQKVQTQKV